VSLKYGKREIEQMIATLEAEYEDVAQAALGVLATAEEIFEKRAQFVVVGQLRGTAERHSIPSTDPEAIKVSLGWFSTEGDAIKASESLAYSSSTQDSFSTWVLPVFHGTPADLHAKQKDKYAEAEQKRKDKARERFRLGVEKHRLAMEERARGGKGSCETCSHQPYEHVTAGTSRGRCLEKGCSCPAWKEKK
jgi:hypothetical protein